MSGISVKKQKEKINTHLVSPYKRLDIIHSQKKQRALYAPIDWDKAKDIFIDKTPTKASSPTLLETARRIPVKDILRVAAAAGVVGILFTCPQALVGIGSLYYYGGKQYRRWKVESTLDQLEKQKYVNVVHHTDGSLTVKITKQGMTRALTYQLDTMKLNKPKKWDKKWRVVMFDVPNKYGNTRDVFRLRLEQLGLKKLQKSVYVSPYSCFQEVEFLRELYGIAITVQYLLVEQIEDDAFLKRQFNL